MPDPADSAGLTLFKASYTAGLPEGPLRLTAKGVNRV